jgi:D-glycero-D-manno-heptose 1,7-bisphosphate phosphatase
MTFINEIDSTWTLFLDRDGVINKEKQDDYIRNLSEFQFMENALEALQKITPIFSKVILVTNQRGVGRGLMTNEHVNEIHEFLKSQIEHKGGKLDGVFFAPDLDKEALNRKPNSGMALQAKELFPEINFEKSIMVGNRLSDMEFGKRLGMKTIYIQSTHPLDEAHDLIDLKLDSLHELTSYFL